MHWIFFITLITNSNTCLHISWSFCIRILQSNLYLSKYSEHTLFFKAREIHTKYSVTINESRCGDLSFTYDLIHFGTHVLTKFKVNKRILAKGYLHKYSDFYHLRKNWNENLAKMDLHGNSWHALSSNFQAFSTIYQSERAFTHIYCSYFYAYMSWPLWAYQILDNLI